MLPGTAMAALPRDLRPHAALAAVLTLVCGGIVTAAHTAPPSKPTSAQQANAQLAAVRARIRELARRRSQELAERDALSAHLRATELAITEKRQALDEQRVAAAEAASRRARLHEEFERRAAELSRSRRTLAAEVRSAAMLGRQPELKLLLNQSDPQRLGRLLFYADRYSQARAAEIAAISAQLKKLNAVEAEIAAETARIDSLAATLDQQLEALQQARAERAGLLATLAGRVNSADQELAALQREEQALESLLADLARVLPDFPTDPQVGFAALRGKLPWPVSGHLMARFHEPRSAAGGTALRWNGVLIAASQGAKVRAPYFGRVVYADWLQGLGQLLIVSHSGGYLSLYGHAEVLYKGVGDPVAPGDVIAALSDAGGDAPRLYFEIRKGREPLDPGQWLKKAAP